MASTALQVLSSHYLSDKSYNFLHGLHCYIHGSVSHGGPKRTIYFHLEPFFLLFLWFRMIFLFFFFFSPWWTKCKVRVSHPRWEGRKTLFPSSQAGGAEAYLSFPGHMAGLPWTGYLSVHISYNSVPFRVANPATSSTLGFFLFSFFLFSLEYSCFTMLC